jgi:hypothetical protein
MNSQLTHLSLSICSTDECSIDTGFTFEMLVVDSNGDPIVDGDGVPTGETTPDVSDASACTTRSVNAAWYTAGVSSVEALDMKTELRRGDGHVLNAYFTNLEADGYLGYATFPNQYARSRYLDGVVITDNALKGGTSVNYGEGVSHFRMKKQN